MLKKYSLFLYVVFITRPFKHVAFLGSLGGEDACSVGFGKNICRILECRDIEEFDGASIGLFPSIVVMRINMLGLFVTCICNREGYERLIICIQRDWIEEVMKIPS